MFEAQASCRVETSLAIRRVLDNNLAAVELLAQLEAIPDYQGTWARHDQLDSVHFDIVASLANAGIVNTRIGDFGDLEIQMVKEKTKYVGIIAAGNPKQVIWVPESSTDSKVDLILRCKRDGWIQSDGPLPPYRAGRDRKFLVSIKKPSSYYVCLGESDVLFGRGVHEIKHDGSDLYYQVLLRLRGQKLDTCQSVAVAGDLTI